MLIAIALFVGAVAIAAALTANVQINRGTVQDTGVRYRLGSDGRYEVVQHDSAWRGRFIRQFIKEFVILGLVAGFMTLLGLYAYATGLSGV
jgi:hypothetical protein